MKRGFLSLVALTVALIFSVTPHSTFGQGVSLEAPASAEAPARQGEGNELPPEPTSLPSGVSVDELNSLYGRFGLPKPKLPEAPKPKAPEPVKKDDEFAETAEEQAAREAEEAARKSETPEQKAERERQEALASETPEEKTAREAEEAKAAAGETIELELSPEHEAYLTQEIEARTADLTKRAVDAETKAAELESKVQTLGVKPGPVPSGVHPLFLVDSDADVSKHQQELSEFKRWATEHFDGFESPDGKVTYTKEQIRARLANVEQELEQIIPAARQSLQMRAAWEPVVKKAYPALYDPKHEDHRTAQGILRACPNLRLFPNHMILIGDAIAGEKARLAANPPAKGAAATGGGKFTVTMKNGKKTIVVKKPAPRTPGGSRPGNASPSDSRGVKASGGVDVAAFAKAGGGRNALTAAVAKFLN